MTTPIITESDRKAAEELLRKLPLYPSWKARSEAAQAELSQEVSALIARHRRSEGDKPTKWIQVAAEAIIERCFVSETERKHRRRELGTRSGIDTIIASHRQAEREAAQKMAEALESLHGREMKSTSHDWENCEACLALAGHRKATEP